MPRDPMQGAAWDMPVHANSARVDALLSHAGITDEDLLAIEFPETLPEAIHTESGLQPGTAACNNSSEVQCPHDCPHTCVH